MIKKKQHDVLERLNININDLKTKKKIQLKTNFKNLFFKFSIPNLFGNGENFNLDFNRNFISFSFLKPIFKENNVTYLEFKSFQTNKKIFNTTYNIKCFNVCREYANCVDSFTIEKIFNEYLYSFRKHFNLLGINFESKIGSYKKDNELRPFFKFINTFNFDRNLLSVPKPDFISYQNPFTIFLQKSKNEIQKEKSIKDKFNDFITNNLFKYPKLISTFIKIKDYYLKNIKIKDNLIGFNLNPILPNFLNFQPKNNENFLKINLKSSFKSGFIIGNSHVIDKFLLGKNIRGYKDQSIGPLEKNIINFGNSFLEIKNDFISKFKKFEVFLHTDVGFCSSSTNLLETFKSTVISLFLKDPTNSFGASYGLGFNYILPRIKNFYPKIGFSYSFPITNKNNQERLQFYFDVLS